MNLTTKKTNLHRILKYSSATLASIFGGVVLVTSNVAQAEQNETLTIKATNLIIAEQLTNNHTKNHHKTSRVKGWNANLVAYNGGAFVKLNGKKWVENNSDGRHTFREVNRDEWSVYLKSNNRDVSIQLDLWTMEVKYSDPNRQFVLYQIKSAKPNRINGWMASKVKYSDGFFVQRDYRTWSENNHLLFEELRRDEWSIYLKAKNKDYYIQLDLWTKEVKYTSPDHEQITLHKVIDAG